MRPRVASTRKIYLLALLLPGCLGFGDLMGGGDDAGPSGSDGGTGDASFDASDSAAPTDAATLADANTFCTQHMAATFCADFDESTDAATGFSTTFLTDGGIVLLDDLVFQSPPASLHAGNLAVDSGSSVYGCLTRATGVTPSTSATADFDLRIDQLPAATSPVEALALVFDSATRSAIQLNLTTSTATAGEEIVETDGGKLFFAHALSAAIASGSWTHVTIALAFAPPRSITVTVGGSVVVDHAPMNAAFVAGSAEIFVGNAYAPGPSPGSTLHYDNVVYDVK